MGEFRISESARKDLDDIWWYISHDDPLAADDFIERLLSKLPTFAPMPYIGRNREELSPGLRSFPFQNYIIFHRPISDGIEVARFLHGAQDLPPLFE